jgi:hypothetical protein
MTLDKIQQYAIQMLHQGGESHAEDDLDEGEVFTEDEEVEWRGSCDLSIDMAHTIRDNPESFLRWYMEVSA